VGVLVRASVLAVVSALLAGCGLLLGPGGDAGMLASSSCAMISGGACTEQAALVAARHPGATNVDLTCTVPVCDRRGGSGTAVVTLADGSTVRDLFAYVGDPGPMPVPTCIGLAPDVCRRVAESRVNDVWPSKRVVAVAVRCAAAQCVANKGEAEVTVTLGDGSTEEGGFGWEGGLP
jgi:hypothetical protein